MSPQVKYISLSHSILTEQRVRRHDTATESLRDPLIDKEFVMNQVKINLKNCYGIKSLQKEFNFSTTPAYALYAPNGVMKSSLAKTFQDAADQKDSQDRIFPKRETERDITDEHNRAIEGSRVLVVLPYDEELGVTEQTSTLLLDTKLKKEYDELLRATATAKATLMTAVQNQSSSKQNMEAEISSAIMPSPSEFDAALIRVKREVEEQTDTPFSTIEYDKIFNQKVLTALNTKDLKNAIEEYARRYNELLSISTYFKKGTFDYYNAEQIAKSLADNGFFDAKHTVSLNADAGNREIKDRKELEGIISKEKEEILTDKELRKKFDDVGRQLTRNADLKQFYSYVRDNEAILSRLNNPEKLKQDVIKSYLKAHENLYNDWMSKHDAAQKRRKELEEEARKQRTQWESVIDIFNDRFFVPFKLEAKNKTEVMLGQTSIIDVGFTYIDGSDSAVLKQKDLLQSLSTGERKALYVLNVIFEIETRKKVKQETLIVVDDLADSFDYRNKYAIVQYLKDISEDGLFKLLLMTHNFDFFRTIESRFVGYSNCLVASKNGGGISLAQATGIRNIFANDWKLHFFDDPKKKIASIPFLRNLVEMTIGDSSDHYKKLTSMLHWTTTSHTITVGDLDDIFNDICQTTERSADSKKPVYDLLMEETKNCLTASGGMNLENKIILSVAIRLQAERFMINRIANPTFVEQLQANQTHGLTEEFKRKFPKDQDAIATLDRVSLMTPENIHVNSFMYEPLIDMSDDHLQRLFNEVNVL